ncbi:hypothetical protein ES707_08121 [subsurface metagenome]
MKIEEKIALAGKELIEQRTRFEDRKKELDGLIKERARLGASAILDNEKDGKRVAEIDSQRNKLRSELEIYPDILREVEAKIEGLKKEKEAGILNKNLIRQRVAARDVERLSEELGVLLEKANEANTELQKKRSQYLKLHELTDQDVITKPITIGSQGSLRILAGVINAELKGHPRPSPRFPPPGPAI